MHPPQKQFYYFLKIQKQLLQCKHHLIYQLKHLQKSLIMRVLQLNQAFQLLPLSSFHLRFELYQFYSSWLLLLHFLICFEGQVQFIGIECKSVYLHIIKKYQNHQTLILTFLSLSQVEYYSYQICLFEKNQRECYYKETQKLYNYSASFNRLFHISSIQSKFKTSHYETHRPSA